MMKQIDNSVYDFSKYQTLIDDAKYREKFDDWRKRKSLYDKYYVDIVKRQTYMNFYKPWADQQRSFRARYKAFLKYYKVYADAKVKVANMLRDIIFVERMPIEELGNAVEFIRALFYGICSFSDEDMNDAIKTNATATPSDVKSPSISIEVINVNADEPMCEGTDNKDESSNAPYPTFQFQGNTTSSLHQTPSPSHSLSPSPSPPPVKKQKRTKRRSRFYNNDGYYNPSIDTNYTGPYF